MMADISTSLLTGLPWVFLWSMGGWWLVRSCFSIRKNEEILAGLGLGLVCQAWLANLLAPWMPVLWAFWLAAVLTFVAGLVLVVRQNGWSGLLDKPHLSWGQLIGFIFLFYLFTAIGRGMAISDDFQNLPVAAMLAVGKIPLQFPLDPSISYPYHYLNLLMAGQFMRLFGLYTWTGVDAARGLTFALAVMLAGIWGQRLTRSALAGAFNGLFFALAGGTRWLFLFLPAGLMTVLSNHVHLIGSGLASASDLNSALSQPWATAGAGPFPFPFAFVNGFNPPMIINYHSGGGAVDLLIAWLLLLLFNHRRSKAGWAVLGLLMAALALSSEVNLAFLCLGFGLLFVFDLLRRRTLKPTPEIGGWLITTFLAGSVSLVQGGVLSGAAADWIGRLIGKNTATYHTFQFSLAFPPVLISGHLGQLSLADPYQLLAAVIEVGPVLLGIPLVIGWGIRAFKAHRWFEAVLVGISMLGGVFLFAQFSGEAGPTALIRVQNLPVALTGQVIFALVWLWGGRLSWRWKVLSGTVLASMLISGLVLLGVQLNAIPYPVDSYYINDLDAQVSQAYWDKLPPSALVFSTSPSKAPILLGRYTVSAVDYFRSTPEWDKLFQAADPYQWRASGFTFAYLDREYWQSLPLEKQQSLIKASCMQLIKEVNQTYPEDFRRLYDISGCQ